MCILEHRKAINICHILILECNTVAPVKGSYMTLNTLFQGGPLVLNCTQNNTQSESEIIQNKFMIETSCFCGSYANHVLNHIQCNTKSIANALFHNSIQCSMSDPRLIERKSKYPAADRPINLFLFFFFVLWIGLFYKLKLLEISGLWLTLLNMDITNIWTSNKPVDYYFQ